MFAFLTYPRNKKIKLEKQIYIYQQSLKYIYISNLMLNIKTSIILIIDSYKYTYTNNR